MRQLIEMYGWMFWNRMKPDESGQGQTEYMILLSISVLVVMVAVVALGIAVYKMWDKILASLPF